MEEAEVERLKRIKAEREKAAKAARADELKADKVSLSYLGASAYRHKGYSRQPEELRKSAERLSSLSIVAAITGAVLDFLGKTIVNVVSGMTGGTLAAVIGGAGIFLMAGGFLFAVAGIIAAIMYKARAKKKEVAAIINAAMALVILLVYNLIMHAIVFSR